MSSEKAHADASPGLAYAVLASFGVASLFSAVIQVPFLAMGRGLELGLLVGTPVFLIGLAMGWRLVRARHASPRFNGALLVIGLGSGALLGLRMYILQTSPGGGYGPIFEVMVLMFLLVGLSSPLILAGLFGLWRTRTPSPSD